MKVKLAHIVICVLVAGVSAFPQAKTEPMDRGYSEQRAVLVINKGIFFARLAPYMVGKTLMQTAVPELGEVLAENYVRIDFRGRVFTKEEEVLRHREAATNRANTMQIVNSEIRVWENVAIAKDTYRIENPYDSDLYPTGEYRVTNIYRKSQGKWYLTLTQWTMVTE